MKDDLLMTHLTLKVGHIFVSQPHEKHWNYEIAGKLGSKPEVTYGVLKKLCSRGWLKTGEDESRTGIGKPRVLYSLTESGKTAIGAALLALQLSTFILQQQAAILADAMQRKFSTIHVSS